MLQQLVEKSEAILRHLDGEPENGRLVMLKVELKEVIEQIKTALAMPPAAICSVCRKDALTTLGFCHQHLPLDKSRDWQSPRSWL